MVLTDAAREIFSDARQMHRAALNQLEAGDRRDAAEKASCATKRATGALILARTGEAPGATAATSEGLDALARSDPRVKSLVGRYYSRMGQLHRCCFYEGGWPVKSEQRIRETADYIRDAEGMAQAA